MLFQKNLPVWERVLRVCIGLIVAVVPLAAQAAPAVRWGGLAVGLVAACSGFLGFCPMCALFGRRLKS